MAPPRSGTDLRRLPPVLFQYPVQVDLCTTPRDTTGPPAARLDPLVELRLDPDQARAAAGFDPVTLVVDDTLERHGPGLPAAVGDPWVTR